MRQSSAAPARMILLRGGADDALSDGDIVRGLRRGDAAAPYLAWQRFGPVVRGSVRRLVGPATDEDDLAQEVFLRFFDNVGRLREPEAVRSFLFGICLRVVRKELRKRWLKRWLRLTEKGVVPEVAGDDDRDADPDAREAARRTYAILDEIGGEGRSLFVTRHIEGLELVQVAKLHGLSLSTTQRRLGRVAKRVEAMVRRDPVLSELVSARKGSSR
jgi:RNA polymerase sigma-70 factor (ECF subfamily)